MRSATILFAGLLGALYPYPVCAACLRCMFLGVFYPHPVLPGALYPTVSCLQRVLLGGLYRYPACRLCSLVIFAPILFLVWRALLSICSGASWRSLPFVVWDLRCFLPYIVCSMTFLLRSIPILFVLLPGCNDCLLVVSTPPVCCECCLVPSTPVSIPESIDPKS